MRHWIPKASLLGLGVGTLLAMAGCGSQPTGAAPKSSALKTSASASSSASTTPSLASFAIGYPAVSADFAPLYVGIDQGFWKKYGLNVKLNVMSGSGSETGALLSGSVQMVVSEATPALEAMAKGAAITYVGSDLNEFDAELWGKTSITSPQQLIGKKLGLLHVNSLTYNAAVQFLQMEKIPLNKVQLDYLGAPPAELAGLVTGKVDAIIGVAPTVFEAGAKGFHMIYNLHQIPHVSNGFLMSKAFVAAHPAEVTAFLKGMIEATAFIKNPANKAAVEADITKEVPITDPTVLKQTYQTVQQEVQVIPTIPSSDLSFTLNYVNQKDHASLTKSQVVDLSLLNKLIQSGFTKKYASNG